MVYIYTPDEARWFSIVRNKVCTRILCREPATVEWSEWEQVRRGRSSKPLDELLLESEEGRGFQELAGDW